MEFLFNRYLNHYKNLWYETEGHGLIQVTDCQSANSRSLMRLKKLLYKEIKSTGDLSKFKNEAYQGKLKDLMRPFLAQNLGLENWAIDLLDHEGYYEVSALFIERIQRDFPEMRPEGIQQALRNLWVIISLQIYLDEEVRLTNAAYGYSMLYPLTDNYLDDKAIPASEKEAFNRRFYDKIKGGVHDPSNDSEATIFQMIDLIHSDYSLEQYPDVTKALLAILDAQNKSLKQQSPSCLYDLDLTAHTFYKGGTSVLADAYLVRGTLTEKEALMAYGYGVLLQMIDDLQDLQTDQSEGHATMITSQAECGFLDGLTEKYISFADHFLSVTFQMDTDKQKALKQLIAVSIELILFGAVMEQGKTYSKAYIKNFRRKSRFNEKSYLYLNQKLRKLVMNKR